jgi:hypothetical protein
MLRLLSFILFCCIEVNANAIVIETSGITTNINIVTWKELRDARVVKQDLGFSCGAASLATLLNEFYGQSLSEKELITAMYKGNNWLSFDDMVRVLPVFDFRGVGYTVSFKQLSQLKIPVIVYLKIHDNDHFSVLRGIDANTVWLADPSLGNRTYSRSQFIKMWETRGTTELKGKFLAVLANDQNNNTSDFFDNGPRRQTKNALYAVFTQFDAIQVVQ